MYPKLLIGPYFSTWENPPPGTHLLEFKSPLDVREFSERIPSSHFPGEVWISDISDLSDVSQSSFLKLLEENSHLPLVLFSFRDKVLPTLLSRMFSVEKSPTRVFSKARSIESYFSEMETLPEDSHPSERKRLVMENFPFLQTLPENFPSSRLGRRYLELLDIS